MNVDLRRIVYSSSATHPLSPADLREILTVARTKNEPDQLTGLLLYRQGHFLQVLEGAGSPLQELLARLVRDPRHEHIRILLEEDIEERSFPTWSMGFRDLSHMTPEDLPGYSHFLTQGFDFGELVSDPGKVLEMLMTFRSQGTVLPTSHSRELGQL